MVKIIAVILIIDKLELLIKLKNNSIRLIQSLIFTKKIRQKKDLSEMNPILHAIIKAFWGYRPISNKKAWCNPSLSPPPRHAQKAI